MSGALNKRQQARNERTLQELIKTVPGNDKCADCGARNPGWASWSLGIFLCVRCASLHRKIGTHVSKVKSLSMDSWSNEQVDNMKRTGNSASNRIYNPRSVRAQLPVDADEVNGAMERYIRQKYEVRSFTADMPPAPRHNTGTTSTSTSSDDRPATLPPKPKRSFFGLRSTSSALPSRHDGMSPPVSPGLRGFEREQSPPPRISKASRIFGSKVGSTSIESFDAKLAQLREMGFTDERRNSTVLKGLNGNLDKTVEALIRLGGSENPSRTESPAVPPKDDQYKAGISFQKTRQTPSSTPLTQTPSAITSTNPFDSATPAHTQQLQQVNAGPMSNEVVNVQPTRSFTTPNSFNPFIRQAEQQSTWQQPSLDHSFQALNLSTPQQPHQLFPNATGGYGNPPQHQNNPFLHTYTPPPMSPNQQQPVFPSLNTQLQPIGLQQQHQFEQSQQGPNPFLRQARSQTFAPSSINSNPFGLSPAQLQQSNPFGSALQPSQPQQSYTFPLNQQPFGQQPNQQLESRVEQHQPQQQPFDQSSQSRYQQQQQQSFQQHPQQPPTPFRHDKSSILALYNMPHPAPQLPQPSTTSDPNSPADTSDMQQVQPFSQHGPKRSVSMPIDSGSASAAGPASGSHNPFAGSLGRGALAPVAENEPATMASPFGAFGAPAIAATGTGIGAKPSGLGAGSRDSVDFMGLSMNGRHSPDAFAGLSARPFVR